MAMPMPGNNTFTIARGGGGTGFLQPRMPNGRYGAVAGLHWTHILYCDDTVDIRDGYNGQASVGAGDVVTIPDSTNPGSNDCTYNVIYVELASRGSPGAHKRAYLDRLQPQAWPSDAI